MTLLDTTMGNTTRPWSRYPEPRSLPRCRSEASGERTNIRNTARGIAITTLICLCLLGCGGGAPGTQEEPQPAASAREDAASKPADLQALVGRWQRTDGGYVLEVRSVADDGSVQAAYFNPKPINVSLAQASVWRGAAALFVEFDDVNYRGSTYELIHVQDRDLLVGTYHQAALNQTFEVVFTRTP
jgi:hypothetical protein